MSEHDIYFVLLVLTDSSSTILLLNLNEQITVYYGPSVGYVQIERVSSIWMIIQAECSCYI